MAHVMLRRGACAGSGSGSLLFVGQGKELWPQAVDPESYMANPRRLHCNKGSAFHAQLQVMLEPLQLRLEP